MRQVGAGSGGAISIGTVRSNKYREIEHTIKNIIALLKGM